MLSYVTGSVRASKQAKASKAVIIYVRPCTHVPRKFTIKRYDSNMDIFFDLDPCDIFLFISVNNIVPV